jgi:hypothetical protein
MIPPPLLADTDFEELVISLAVLALFALFRLLKWAAAKSSEADQDSADRLAPQRPPPIPPAVHRPPAPAVTRRPTPFVGARRGSSPVRRQPQPMEAPPQAQPATWDVAEELRRQQQRLEQEEAQRAQRLTTTAPAEADTAGIEARLLHIRPTSEPARAATAAEFLAGLRAPEEIRKAILHYEIFSAPKALRAGPEMWEL